MNRKYRFLKKVLSVLLCLLLALGTAVPAFAMEPDDDNISLFSHGIDDNDINDPADVVLHTLQKFVSRYDADQERARLEAESWTALAGSYFGTAINIVSNIGVVITFVNGSITLLRNLGILESETDKMDNILEGINSIQMSVNEINRNVDEIQETLVSEFSELDLKFQEQDYNHYKDDVWAQYYSNAVAPLKAYQNEYNDDVRWLLVNYIEQWQGADGDCLTDLRALYGKDGGGDYVHIYSGKNLGDVGEALPREPKASIDSVPVEYSVTIPSEYISANLDEISVLTADNCTDKLIEALENGVYDAAQDKKLSAYGGFDIEWSYLTEAEKRETAKKFAADLADSLAFACAYNAANERRFASNVKSAYENFAKWTQGEESLTSPAYAQFKMLALTHGFEGEIKEQAETVVTYLMLMDVNFATFAQTVIALSKAHGEDDRKDIQSQWTASEISILKDFSNFITGNPNYCYQLGKPVEYRNTSIASEMSFIFGRWANHGSESENIYKYKEHYESTPWTLFESEEAYSSDKAAAQAQKNASQTMLTDKTVSTKDAKLIYTMYQSSGFDGSFAEYLASNNVAADSKTVADNFITSFRAENFDLNSGMEMKCYLPTEHGSENVTAGQTYVVSGGVPDALTNDCFHIHDRATGSVFDSSNGTFNENAVLAARAFYGESKWTNMDEMVVFSKTPIDYEWTSLSHDELIGMGVDASMDENYNVVTDITVDYGMLISAELNTYTFPAGTKEIPDYFLGKDISFKSIVLNGIPDEIGDKAFAGVGTAEERCLLTVPNGFETGSLEGKWHGGYFGDVQITLDKFDGSGETKTVAAVSGAPISTVVNPFGTPEHRIFKGWSYSNVGNNPADSTDPVIAGQTLFAVWDYDHEHDFEVSKSGNPTGCISDGSTDELTCKICGYKEYSQKIPAFGHSCEFTLQADGTYLAQCVHGDYYAFLSPRSIGDFTVWSENNSGSNVTYIQNKYEGDSISVNASGVYVIANTNPSKTTNNYISVNDGVKASMGLAGVNIAPFARVPAINAGNGTVHITLIDEMKNTLAGGGDRSAVEAGGNLIFDGNGSLVATAPDSTAISTSGANTVFYSGRITAESGENCGIGVRNGSNDKKIVISENACVCSKNGLGAVAVNENGENVYPVCIRNESNSPITVDGRELPYTTAPGETVAYVYLTDEEHEITVGGEPFEYELIDGRFYFEKEYGDFTVTLTDTDSVSYADGVLTVKNSIPVTIKNTDSTQPTTDRIFVPFGISANITLNGVFIDGTVNDVSPIKIADGSGGDVKITLAENSENVLRGGSYCAGLSKNGSSGTLTIDGKGALTVSGGFDSAAIGSDDGYVVHGIIINDGIIDATVTSYRAAAIGSGCVDAKAAPTGEKVYTAEGIIINGGRITARSTDSAAIGAGGNDSVSNKTFCAKDIIINGGTVIAQSERSAYTIGAGVYAKAENIRINGGVVTAESTVSSDFGGIGANLGSGGIVIEPMASVKAQINDDTINSKGEDVSLNVISAENGKKISVNGVLFPYSDHNGEKKVYIYASRKDKIKQVPRFEIEESDRGTVTSDPIVPAEGDKVTLTAEANEGYVFKQFEITPDLVELDGNSFVMPDYGVTVKAQFSRIGTITVKDCENCTVTSSKSIAAGGEKITLRIVPDEGMVFSRWDITPNVEITNNTFIMPEEDVVVSGICVPKTHTVTWNVMGEKNTENVSFGSSIIKPENPTKEGYVFNGWTPDVAALMPDEDLEYSAVFSPITYYAEFKAGEKTVAKVPYTLDDTSVAEPAIPAKIGYVSSWEDYTLTAGGITVNAVYTASAHEHTFATKYSTNEYMHWYASTCGHEDIAKGLGEHTFGDGIKAGSATIYICTECSYVKIVTDELAELRAQAITELEAAAGAERSEAMQSAVDLAKTAIERATTAEEIESARESGLAVIHASDFAIGNCTTSGSFVYGLEPLLTEASFGEKYIVNDTVSVRYNPSSKDVLGTGSTVSVTYYSGNTDEYSIVIFGDVNGDGWYDGMDSIIVSCLANGMLSQEDVTEAQYMAADCNHDGVIDSLDVEILSEAGVLRAQVEQSEETLKTSSAYAEYLNLIDQTVETETIEVVEENDVDPGYTFNFFDMILNFIKEIIAVIKTVIAYFK